jgi:hypothetical protein
MSKNSLNVSVSEKDLSTLISALLFSCSVNVTSNTNEEYQAELFKLAKQLKELKPDIKLNNVQFLKEENYEDVTSNTLFEEFKNNLEVVTFEEV